MEPETYSSLGQYLRAKTGASVDYFFGKKQALNENGHRTLATDNYDLLVTGAKSGLGVVNRIRHPHNPNNYTPVMVFTGKKNILYSLLLRMYLRKGDCCMTYPANITVFNDTIKRMLHEQDQ